ncbi:MAG: hypothetical protein U0797_16235 [Gemmataceae bacterium]
MERPTSMWSRRRSPGCHRFIWTAEKVVLAAFVGFAKLLFVKLWEDRGARKDSPAR